MISVFPVPHLIWSTGRVSISLLFDQSAQYDIEGRDDDYNRRANGLFHIETQLPNSWTAGVQYFGSYNRLADDEYTDNMAAFVSDEWGLVSVGNVTGSVNENTRRRRVLYLCQSDL